MSKEIMQESTQIVECNAFHRGMSVLEANLRNTEDSESTISVLLKGAAEFYGASRASVVEADWELGIGVITYEWCSDGIPAQRDMLQCLPMEKFPRWKKALKANKPLMISDLDGLAKSYPDEAAFFREYGVTTLLAAPFSKRINQGFIAVDDPTRYTDDPVFLFIASYAWCWSSTKSNNSNQFGQLQKPPNIIRRMSISISLEVWRSSAPREH